MKWILITAIFLLNSCVLPNDNGVIKKQDKPLERELEMQINQPLYDATSANDTRIKISLWDQKAWLLNQNDKVLISTDISTGIDGRKTPSGNYRILEKRREKRSNKYGRLVDRITREVKVEKAWEYKEKIPSELEYEGIAMPYWMRLTWSGIGMHVGKFEKRIRSSFGCIRVFEKAQPYFFKKTVLGTRVELVNRSLVSEMKVQDTSGFND